MHTKSLMTMLKRMVGSTFSSCNIHEFVEDNSNSYMNIVMDAMRMNQVFLSESLCNISLDEELFVNTTRFFKFLKDFNEPLWDKCIIHNNFLIIA